MDIESAIEAHFSHVNLPILSKLTSAFSKENVVVFDNFLPDPVFTALREEAFALLEAQSKRRELMIHESGNTPRAYTSVDRDSIAHNGRIIPAIFHNKAVLDFLSKVADAHLSKVPYAPEEFIINRQSQIGDTHGWHWDDYAYAFIYVLEAPDPLLGGRVEYIPHMEWRKSDTKSYLKRLLSENKVSSLYIPSGKCYLMKANTTLHRVAPLTGTTCRTVVVYTFASEEDLTSRTITHGSMEEIYPESTQILTQAL